MDKVEVLKSTLEKISTSSNTPSWTLVDMARQAINEYNRLEFEEFVASSAVSDLTDRRD